MTPGLAQRILGLCGPPADEPELRRARRRFALARHPDRAHDDPSAAERFQLGQRADEVLRARLDTRRPAAEFVPLASAVPRSSREWLV